MIKALVFDFDGVLADSEPLHLRCYQEVLAPLGIALTRDEYYARYLGFDDEGVFTQVAAAHRITLDRRQLRALIVEKSRVFDEVIASGDVLYPGAASCIERLAGVFRLGIASGALREEIEAILHSHRLERHFQFVVASGDTPKGKPAPDPYRRAAELHGLPPAECLAIEDSRWGIDSAKAAGLWCIAITNTYPREQLAMADRVIRTLDEITPDFVAGLVP